MKLTLVLIATAAIAFEAHAQEMSADLPALDITAPAPAPTEIEAALDETPQSRAEAQWAQMPNDGFVKTATYSEFFFLPAGGQNSAQFNYRQSSTPNTRALTDQYGQTTTAESNRETRDYDLHYARSIARSTYLSFDLGYETESMATGDVSMKSSGMKDLGLGLTQIARFERWNLLWGANFTASPANAFPATPNGVRGNRFSGGYAAIPFVGFESTSHTAAWGGRLKSAIAYKQYNNADFNDPLSATTLDAFYEVPVLPTARLGFNVAAQRDGASSLSGFQSVFDTFGAGAYSRISLKQQADVILGIAATTHDSAENSTTETEATIGLRKSL